MNLLVVGGSGFIGRNVVERLAKGGHPFRRVVATYTAQSDFPTWSRSLGVEPLRLDLSQPVRLPEEFDAAIYTAGNANHATAADVPLSDLELNACALLRFLDGFRGRLVYLSSGAVYYGRQGHVHPGLPLTPTFAYGISKLASEHYAGAARARARLASLVSLRLFYAYGRHDKSRRLVPRLVAAAKRAVDEPFALHGTGASWVDALDAAFVAEIALLTAARGDLEGAFDLCGGQPLRVIEFASRVVQLAGGSTTVTSSGAPEEFPVTFHASPQPLFDALGLAGPPDLAAGLMHTIEWLERRNRP